MARIKQVINERRLAYEKAVEIVDTERDAHHDAQVLEHLKEERRVMKRKERRDYKLRQAAKAKAAEEAEEAKFKATPQGAASEAAAAGLFGTSS